MANTYLNINATNVNGGGSGSGFANPAIEDLDMGAFDVLQAGGNNVWTVAPEETSVEIQAAIDACAAAGGGTVKLLGDSYVIPDNGNSIGIEWPGDSSLVVLEGNGQTVLESEVDTVGYTLLLNQTIAGQLLAEACDDIVAGDQQVTLTTVANGAFFLKGYIVCIRGLDADSRPRQIMNEVLANGSGVSGIVTLTGIINCALTSVNITAYPFGYGNGVRNLKIVHTDNASHAVGFIRQIGAFMENVVMDGADFSGSYAVELTQDNHNIHISDCVIRNYKYDGLASANGEGFIMADCSNILVENTLFHKNGDITGTEKCNIFIFGITENIIFKNCEILYSTSHGFKGHGSGWGLNILIDGCTFSHNGASGILFDNATQYADIKITNCHFNDNADYGVEFAGTQSVISNNTFYRNADAGIFIKSPSNYLTVEGNTLIKNAGDGGILSTASDVTIIGNNCSLNTAGIYCFSNGTNINISGNVCNGNTRGIRFDGGTDANITGNIARSNGTANIVVDNSCSNFIVSSNNFRGGTVTYGTGTGHIIVNNQE